MANYELNILRNSTPLSNRDEAISILNKFEGHKIGQPVSLIYFDEKLKTKILFAVGKKNASDVVAGDKYGEDFYDIIGDIDGEIKWNDIQNSILVETPESLKMASAETDKEFKELAQSAKTDNLLTIINQGKIYKGNRLISSLDLANQSLFSSITIDGEIFSGSFENVLIKLIQLGKVYWANINGDIQGTVQFIKTYQEDFDNDDSDIEKVNNTIYHVQKQISFKDEGKDIVLNHHKLYIGKNLIGDTYNTTRSYDNTMSQTIGGIKKGTTIKKLLQKGSMSAIMDELLFPIINPVITDPTLKLSYNKELLLERGSDGILKEDFEYTTTRGEVSLDGDIKTQEFTGEPDKSTFTLSCVEQKIWPLKLTNPFYTFQSNIGFTAGTYQPIDSNGDNYKTPYPGGNITSNNIIINTCYKYYYGTLPYDFICYLIKTKTQSPQNITLNYEPTLNDMVNYISADDIINGGQYTILSNINDRGEVIDESLMKTYNGIQNSILNYIPDTIDNFYTKNEIPQLEYLVWCIPAEYDNIQYSITNFSNDTGDENLKGYCHAIKSVSTKNGNISYNIYIRGTAGFVIDEDYKITAHVNKKRIN